jgi:hypothetical protein
LLNEEARMRSRRVVGRRAVQEVERFKKALEDAELRPNTIETYVGRSEVFLRFISDDYVP